MVVILLYSEKSKTSLALILKIIVSVCHDVDPHNGYVTFLFLFHRRKKGKMELI